MPIPCITTGAPEDLLPPSPLPKDSSTPRSAVHVDGDVPEPLPGVSGHVPLPTTDRFALCFLCKFSFTVTFVGVKLILSFLWLPDGDVGDEVEEEEDEDDDAPVHPPENDDVAHAGPLSVLCLV